MKEYTFESFKVNTGNRNAYETMLKFCEKSGPYLIFLNGPACSGKTHFLKAAQTVFGDNAAYITGNDFTDELVDTIRKGNSTADFKDTYKNTPCLLFDCFQYIQGRPSTMEEFLNILDYRIVNGLKTVLASDIPINEFENTDEHITARIEKEFVNIQIVTNDYLEQFFYYNNGNLIEGFLGDPNECKILFVLKEPDTGEARDFWFRNGVEDESKRVKTAKRYFHILGKIAAIILKKDGDLDNEEFLKSVLEQCAYINLNPIKGETKESPLYKEVLKKLKSTTPKQNIISCDSEAEDIAANRKYILNEINCEYIVTVKGIYKAITELLGKKEGTGIKYNNKPFGAVDYCNNKKLLWFYHPAYRSIKYDKLNEMTFNI